MDVASAVVGGYRRGTKHTNGLNFARVRSNSIRVLHSAFAGSCAMVVAGAASFGHGKTAHAAGEVGGGLASGRGSSPATVARGSVVLGCHYACHSGESWVVVGVEAVLLHLLATLLLVRLVRLALAPEEDGCQDDQCHRNYWHNDCNGNCSTGRKTAGACCSSRGCESGRVGRAGRCDGRGTSVFTRRGRRNVNNGRSG